jgi:signal transduction histidine kinase/CheY-like chemotaxis protein
VGWINKFIVRHVPFEYLAMVVGFILLITSIGFLILQNQDLILLESKNSELYEDTRAIDTTFIQVIKTASDARRFIRSQRAEDLATYQGNYQKSIHLLDVTGDEISKGVLQRVSVDIEELFLSILWELRKTLNAVNDVVITVPVDEVEGHPPSATNDTITEKEVNNLIDRMYGLHETKLSAVDRLREQRSERLAKTMAQNNLRTSVGIVVSILFFMLSFILLRNKMVTIRRYSMELKEETQRAQRAERVKSEFLANMSHEIRTPMTAILGFSELLHDGVTDPKYRSYVTGIQTSGKALLALINDILDLSKIEAGRMTIKPREIDLPSFISTVDLIFSQMAKNKGLEFSIQIAPEVPENVVMDDNRVRQVLTNLLGNAVKFTHKGFIRLSVSIEKDGQTGVPQLCFAVADSGIGISKQDQTVIFEAFRQADGQTTRSYGGTGLGLSIALQLARLMGGTITVQSEEHRGSTFTLILPLEQRILEISAGGEKPGTPDSKTVKMDIHLTGGTVLIVEDEPYNRTILREFLGDQQVRIITANNGLEALTLLEQETVDVVVTDMMMPKMSGSQLIQRIRASEKLRSIPIIIASASTPPEQYMDLPEIQGFLKKPFRRSDFLALLAPYLPHEECPCVEEAAPLIGGKPRTAEESWGVVDESVRKALVEKYEKRLKMLRVTLSMDGIAELGRDLTAEGQERRWEALAEYGTTLSTAAENLDIDAISQLFIRLGALLGYVDGA